MNYLRSERGNIILPVLLIVVLLGIVIAGAIYANSKMQVTATPTPSPTVAASPTTHTSGDAVGKVQAFYTAYIADQGTGSVQATKDKYGSNFTPELAATIFNPGTSGVADKVTCSSANEPTKVVTDSPVVSGSTVTMTVHRYVASSKESTPAITVAVRLSDLLITSVSCQ